MSSIVTSTARGVLRLVRRVLRKARGDAPGAAGAEARCGNPGTVGEARRETPLAGTMAATGHAVVLAVLRVALAAALAAACIAVCPETACPAPKDPALRHRERLLGPHFDGPCRKYGVSKALAMAVARQESSMHPYALNVAGRSVRPRSREEALRIADAAARAGKSYDVGLMQINAYWIRKYRLSHAALLDPRGNIAVGVWLLRQQINRHGPTWKAVGTYHSHTPWRRDDYARRVRRHLRNVLADYGGVPGR